MNYDGVRSVVIIIRVERTPCGGDTWGWHTAEFEFLWNNQENVWALIRADLRQRGLASGQWPISDTSWRMGGPSCESCV